MEDTTGFQGKPTQDGITLAGGVRQQNAQIRRYVGFTLWALGFVLLLVGAVIVHSHPGPWPIDLQSTITLQHLQVWSWVITPIVWTSIVDNVLPSTISFIVWFIALMLIGVFVQRRGGSPMRWYVTAIFLALGAGVAAGLDLIIGTWVARPRPSSPLIHVYMSAATASFPSGHVENVVVYYGFLLYLSLTKPVSEWRYRWVLIPFQIYAVLNILLIGYSRMLEGSHWLTDALGGYLAGALWLSIIIFLYRWTLKKLEERRAKRLVEQPAMATQAHQPAGETMREKSLETVQVVEKKSLESVQVVEKKMKPYEELFLKCRDDWIHHLAQALAYSFLTTLVSIAIILLPIYSAILGRMDTPMQHLFSVRLEVLFPPPLSSQLTQVFGKALDIFSHASPIAKLATFLLAALLGSFLFSLMESCFDVIYHLPPRPFLRRHLVALGMLFLFVVLSPIIVLAATAPTIILSLAHVFPPGNIPESNLIYELASIVGSILLSLILFQAIYVLVPSRHIRIQTVGRHIRNSWQGTLVATGALQLGLLLFHFYTTSSLSYYIGDLGFIIITLLYFWLFALILLFGAEINAFFAEGIRVPQNDLITQASKDGYR